MQKSLQQQSPYKKRGDQLSSSDFSNRSGGELTNYTEIMISTNNKEVPFISIFKPDSTKEQNRIQAAIFLHKSIKQFQRARMRFSLTKIINARHHQIRIVDKCKMLCQMAQRNDKWLMKYAFVKMAQNQIKSKAVGLAVKALNRFQTNFKIYNKKYAIFKLQINSYKGCIEELKDNNELYRQITNLESQLQSVKQSAFSENFIAKAKGYQRYMGNIAQNLRKNDFQGIMKQQIKRFQQLRSKMTPKKRDLFENELIVIIIANIIKGYDVILTQNTSKIEQLQDKIGHLQVNDELLTLKEQLQMRNNEMQKVNHLVEESDKFSDQLKKTLNKITSPQGLNTLNSLIGSQATKLQSYKVKQSESIINKMAESGVLLCSLISTICQQSASRQNRKKQYAFKVQYAEQSIIVRFFKALQATLLSAQVPSQIIHQILQFKQQFQQISSKYEEEVQQRIASQSLIEQMTMISSQLKQQNQNLKALQRNYYDLLSENTDKDAMISTLTNSINDKSKEIQSLQEKVKQLTSSGLNVTSRQRLDSGKPRARTVQLVKQLLTLKMSIESQVMAHQKQARELKNEIYQYQTVIDQLQAEIIQKDHKLAKQKEEIKGLKEPFAQLSKLGLKKSSLFMQEESQSELSKVRLENQLYKTQLKQSKQNNEMLMQQLNQTKRQFYKKQKTLQQKIRQKDQLLVKLQMQAHLSSNNTIPKSHLPQSANKQSQIVARDQEIKLLTVKVKSLQALLSDITGQYHDLQLQFQQANASPLITDLSEVKYTETKQPGVIREVDSYAIMDDKILSQKLKELMASNESLAYSIDLPKQCLQQNLSQKRNQILLEKDCLLHLVFSIFLDVQKINSDSQQAGKIWKQLCQIKANHLSKDFLTNLQSYSKVFIANSIKK